MNFFNLFITMIVTSIVPIITLDASKKRKQINTPDKKPASKKSKTISNYDYKKILQESSDRRKRRQAQKVMTFRQIPALYQNDDWRCGYFAVFHMTQTLKTLHEGGIKALNNLNLNTANYQNQYDHWEHELNQDQKLVQIPNTNLSSKRVEKLLEWELKKLDHSDWLEQVVILDAQQEDNGMIMDLETIPLRDTIILTKIEKLRLNNIPQGLIIVNDAHWTSFIIFPDGSFFGTDSLSKNHDNLAKQQYVHAIFNLFINTSMPSVQQISKLKKAIRKTNSPDNIDFFGLTAKQKAYLIKNKQKKAKEHSISIDIE